MRRNIQEERLACSTDDLSDHYDGKWSGASLCTHILQPYSNDSAHCTDNKLPLTFRDIKKDTPIRTPW